MVDDCAAGLIHLPHGAIVTFAAVLMARYNLLDGAPTATFVSLALR